MRNSECDDKTERVPTKKRQMDANTTEPWSDTGRTNSTEKGKRWPRKGQWWEATATASSKGDPLGRGAEGKRGAKQGRRNEAERGKAQRRKKKPEENPGRAERAIAAEGEPEPRRQKTRRKRKRGRGGGAMRDERAGERKGAGPLERTTRKTKAGKRGRKTGSPEPRYNCARGREKERPGPERSAAAERARH